MGKFQTDWILDTSNARSAVAGLLGDVDKYDRAVDNSTKTAQEGFAKQAKAATDFNNRLDDGMQIYKKVEVSAKAYEAEVRRLADVHKELVFQQNRVGKGSADYDKLGAKITDVKTRVRELGGELDKATTSGGAGIEDVGKKSGLLGNIMGKLGPVIGGVFALSAIFGFGMKVLEVTSNFQKFEAVLTNTLGSGSKAQQALAMIQDFAAGTNFSVQEATDAYIKFANRGIKLTKDEMLSLADVANSTGKSLDQLTEAVLDSMTGENERLKEFGVIAKKNGDTTAFTFKGVTTEVKNTSAEITKYLIGLGKLEGVTGSTAAISNTLGGKLSNLGDAFDKLLNTIGQSSSFVFGAFIDGAKAALDFVTKLVGDNGGASAALEKERLRVESLRIEITGLNIGNEKRTALIQQLQKEYPAFLKNIDAEKVSNEELSAAIDKVSESLAGRILVQRKQDEIAKQAEKTADALQLKLEAEQRIRTNLAKLALEQQANIKKGVFAQRALDEVTGTESVGRGIPINQLTQGVKLDVAGEQVLTAYKNQRLELNANSRAAGDLARGLQDLEKADKALAVQTRAANELARQRANLVKGLFGDEKALADLTADGPAKAAALTAAQKAQITQYKRLVDEARNYETALSTAELKKLNAALLAEQKKADKARADALKALLKELADLEKQAAKARLELVQKDSREYLDEVRRRALAEIDLIEKNIKAAEAKYKAAGGKGVNADGQLSAKQQQDLNTLREVVNRDYFAKLGDLTEKENKALFAVQASADAKQLRAVQDKYDTEIAAARKAKNEVLALALEKARGEETARITLAQALKTLDEQEALKRGVVETDDTSKGNIAKVNGLDPKAPGRTLDDKVLEAEKAKQRALLDIGIEFAKKRIELLGNSFDQESQLIKLNAEKQLNELTAQRAKLDDKGKSLGERIRDFDLLTMLGVKDEDKQKVKDAFNEVIGYINDFAAQQVEAANQLVAKRKDDVEEKQNDLNTEIELNKLGFASNVETKRAELEEAKKQRAEALADQKKAVQAQIALDTVTQTIGLITSSVKIIEGFSAIPIIGLPLGIAAVAALFGAFAVTKAKAMSAAKLEQGGFVGGKRHAQGGNKYRSIDGNDDIVEIEAGERVMSRRAVSQFDELLEAVHNNDRRAIVDYALSNLLAGTGVRLSDNVPGKVRAQHTELASYAQRPTDDGGAALAALADDVAAIRGNTKPQPQYLETETEKIRITGNKTRITRKQ
jgi:hypothetical protein